MLTNRLISQVFFHFMRFVQRTYETNAVFTSGTHDLQA